MKKILLWFVSNDVGLLDAAIKILEWQQNGIELVGVTAAVEIPLFRDGKNIPFIPFDKVTEEGGGGG